MKTTGTLHSFLMVDGKKYGYKHRHEFQCNKSCCVNLSDVVCTAREKPSIFRGSMRRSLEGYHAHPKNKRQRLIKHQRLQAEEDDHAHSKNLRKRTIKPQYIEESEEEDSEGSDSNMWMSNKKSKKTNKRTKQKQQQQQQKIERNKNRKKTTYMKIHMYTFIQTILVLRSKKEKKTKLFIKW